MVGFGTSLGVDNESREIAQDNARADLARSILVNVESLISAQTIEDNSHLSQSFSSVTRSSTSLRLVGLKTEVYVEHSRQKETTYSLAFARRAHLNRVYTQERKQIQDRIKGLVKLAENNHDKKELALKYYFQLLPLFEKFKEIDTILMSVFSLFTESNPGQNRSTYLA